MDPAGRIVAVTGAASGIGKALAHAFARAGAAQVVCADLDGAGAQSVARAIGGIARQVDVGHPVALPAMIEEVEETVGPIDIFCSNAGIAIPGGVEVADEAWEKIWQINVMAHVRAARVLVPRMKERGQGWLLNTASAAGLLNQIGSAPYGVTKHAAVGLAEWLAFTYGDDGIGVSVLCPQAVRTEMTRGMEDHVAAIDGMLEPEAVAAECLEAIREGRFLIAPHRTVLGYMKAKAEDYDRWIGGMRRLNRQFGGW